jgi:hypothetical protein
MNLKSVTFEVYGENAKGEMFFDDMHTLNT